MNEPLTDIEYDILNAIYFVEPFQNILDECKAPEKIVADVLKQLIARKYVTPMQFDEQKKEFIRTYFYDSDNMRAYHYLATKDGLMIHNSR
jgi:predicted methyltransferase